MSNLAINDAGDVLAFDGQGWKPAPMAQNDAGERVVFDGSEWKPLGALTGAAKGSKAQGRSDAAANAFGQGATLGFGDELAAGVRAVAPGVSNFMMRGPALQRDESIGGSPTPQTVSTAPTVQGRYDEELARQRAQTKSDHEAYPAMTTGANIAGNVATTALALPNALVTGGGLLTNIARGAALGAGLGGAAGFGEGEGGLSNRASNAVPGAAIGAGVGGVAPAVGAMASTLYQRAAPPVLNKLADIAERFAPKVEAKSVSAAAPEGGQVTGDSLATRLADNSRVAAGNIEDDAATSRLALELARSGGVKKAGEKLQDLGEGAFIADTSEGAKRLANVGFILPGDAADKYRAAFGLRNRETGPRFEATLPGAPPIADAQRYLQAYKTKTGSEIYDPVLRSGDFNVSPEMQGILKSTPAIREAMDQITADAAKYGQNLTPAEVAHLVKQTLNANTDAAFQAGKAVNKNMVRDAGEKWESALYDANPAIRQADEAYAKVASLSNPKTGEGFLERGQRFMRSGTSEAATEASPAALSHDLPGATPKQLQAFQVGSTNVMRDAALTGPKSTRRLADTIAESAIMRDKLALIYGQGKAGDIVKRAGTEKTFAETANSVLGGSQTAQRGASLADEFALNTVPHSPMSLVKMLAEQYQKVRAPSEAVRSRLADMLANPHAADNAQTLSLVEALLKRQAAARSYSSGLAGGAGGSFASSP